MQFPTTGCTCCRKETSETCRAKGREVCVNMRNSTSLHFLIFAAATDFRIRKSGRTFKYRIFLPVANNIGIKFPKIQTAPVKIPKELFKKNGCRAEKPSFLPKILCFHTGVYINGTGVYSFPRRGLYFSAHKNNFISLSIHLKSAMTPKT